MHDLVTLGEVLLRLSVAAPARFETTRQLDVQIGGAEGNVAATVARLGLSTAWVSALPANQWGERVLRELRGHGVDTSGVVSKPGARLGVYFVEYGPRPRPIRVLYDRRESAFSLLEPSEVDWGLFREARIVHVSGVTPALGARGRALVHEAIRHAAVVSYDVNYRAALWSPGEARDFAATVLPSLRYLFVGQSEARSIFELTGSPESIVEGLARLAPKATVTLMRGEEGSLVRDGVATYRPRCAHAVELIDPIGAGDAYVAGFLWAVLEGRSLQEAVDAGATVAALKCSMWGDIAAVDRRDVEDLLAGGPDVRR